MASVMKRFLNWIRGWWEVVQFGAISLILALSPSSYRRPYLSSIAREIVRATMSNLLWFSILSALVSVVLIRIVVVTAISYGLSRFAMEMVVRVLVLELIPLTAALFVALRWTLPESLELEHQHLGGGQSERPHTALDPLRYQFMPRVMAGVFAVWMLAAVSCSMVLVLAYLAVYGFTPYALEAYNRVVGQIFSFDVVLIFTLKILFFSWAVAVIPFAVVHKRNMQEIAALAGPNAFSMGNGLASMVRLFAVILFIEMVSLMGNYYY